MKITFKSPITLTFALLAVVFYFLFQADGDIPRIFVLQGDFQWTNWKWYVSLVGYTLSHGSIDHLIGNISIILLLGPMIEKRYGPKRMLMMLSLTGLITAVIHIVFWSHHLIGASGLVFMMIVLSSLVDIRGNELPFAFILIVLLYIGQEVIRAFSVDGVSQFAHISGGVLGMIFGYSYRSKGSR